MSLPRNDSASIISSLQMDYGDSDEEESDSKQNSFSSSKDDSSVGLQMKINSAPDPIAAPGNNSSTSEEYPPSKDSQIPPIHHIQISDVEQAKASPADNISDDEHDSQSSRHSHRHSHTSHHHHQHQNEEQEKKAQQERVKELLADFVNTDSPASQGSVSSKNKKATSLVSYGHDEDVGSDEEESEPEDEDDASNTGSPTLNVTDASILSRSVQNMSKEDIQIPPEPPGKCPYPLQRKIELEYEKMKKLGVDHNRIMQEKKNFRNPSIYEKLIDFIHINENGTNFPPEIYNPNVWGKESFYDQLDKVQRQDMEKREKDKKDRTKIEFLVGTKKASHHQVQEIGPDEKKRKTKWDAQPAGSGSQGGQFSKPSSTQSNPGVVNLTSSATGTKGKVISAVGTLSKKPSK